MGPHGNCNCSTWLHSRHPSIVAADHMSEVWLRFTTWVVANMREDELACLVAWNGETCDLKWLWQLTQAPLSSYEMPAVVSYFMDPYRVIAKYEGCKINPKKSKIESLELGVVWSFLDGGEQPKWRAQLGSAEGVCAMRLWVLLFLYEWPHEWYWTSPH